jgi:hypothetical protein
MQSLFILLILKLFRRGRLFIFRRLHRWELLVIALFSFLFCLLDNIILTTTYRIISIKYNRLWFIRHPIFNLLLLLFLLTFRRCTKRIRHILWLNYFQYLLETLYKLNPLPLRRRVIIRQLNLLLLLFTILSTNKLFDTDLISVV